MQNTLTGYWDIQRHLSCWLESSDIILNMHKAQISDEASPYFLIKSWFTQAKLQSSNREGAEKKTPTHSPSQACRWNLCPREAKATKAVIRKFRLKRSNRSLGFMGTLKIWINLFEDITQAKQVFDFTGMQIDTRDKD